MQAGAARRLRETELEAKQRLQFDRIQTANQPHRQQVQEGDRFDPRAENELGRLSLRGQITQKEYMAGQEYARRVGAYRATIGGPNPLSGAGLGKGCNPEACDPCRCREARVAYMEIYDALAQGRHARRIAMITNEVVINDAHINREGVWVLRLGLSNMAKYLRY